MLGYDLYDRDGLAYARLSTYMIAGAALMLGY